MKTIFKPEDFKDIGYVSYNTMSAHANKLFNQWLESQTVVYGYEPLDETQWTSFKIESDTHKAYLIFPEPIVKVCEKHEPERMAGMVIGTANGSIICQHCGVELVAGWKAK